jgi:hypothetical protein
VGIITVVFIIIMAYLSTNNTLTPGVTMVICFILFVLYLTGVVETGIQLFGAGAVSQNCQQFVTGAKVTGTSTDTLAWLQQQNICKFHLDERKSKQKNLKELTCEQANLGMQSLHFHF